MSRSAVGYSLPPGVTLGMLEAAYGGGDSNCLAWSPDMRYECNLPMEHKLDHEHHLLAVKYRQVPPCWNSNCPELSGGGYDCKETDAHLHGEPGSFYSSDSYGGETSVVIASWPQREDDFNDDGEPTIRGERPPATVVNIGKLRTAIMCLPIDTRLSRSGDTTIVNLNDVLSLLDDAKEHKLKPS